MATNRIPQGASRRIRLANAMLGGLQELEADLGLSVVTHATLNARLNAYLTAHAALLPLKNAWDNARNAGKAAKTAGIGLGNKVRRHFLDLEGFGPQPNANWVLAGFPVGTTAVPRENLVFFLDALKGYFTDHPAHEVAVKGITAAAALSAQTALTTAMSAVGTPKHLYSSAKAAEEAAFAALGAEMSRLVGELKLHLGDADTDWYAFGLRRPADPETPGVVDNLEFSPAGNGRIFADWDDESGADRYFVWVQIVGTDAAPRKVKTVEDSEALLDSLPSGTQVKITITAVNLAGEGVPNTPVEIQVP